MRRLAVVRPEPGASATVERARAIGLDAFALPLFEVAAIAWEVPPAAQFDALLLTSANAVRHGGAGLDELRGLPVHAVGEATAAAARAAGFEIASCGDGGVERLLEALPPDLRLLHLCGEHRTAVKPRQKIIALPVYRSTQLPAPEALHEIDGQAVAVHSPRAGQRLAELVDQAGIDRAAIRIAAISPAAAAAAGAGWDRIEVAETPADAALLALAARLCDNPVTR